MILMGVFQISRAGGKEMIFSESYGMGVMLMGLGAFIYLSCRGFALLYYGFPPEKEKE